ncbi:SDR family NAD(P)-dependent oxidoreductase [Nocardia jinanensis]|uniref:Dehydrogenase/reductase n=1 Tax=Nocardia jinanensis TaxID=382504 RepID=A0A917RTD6_9NOCA|nr:SDR family NAD(P)-dependent oxidoreductase [Nocardia jinanensis]GGL29377.1 putative dehydrogenase/reductase [Nocardia jinanensis]
MPHTIVMTGASRGIGRAAAERILRGAPDAHLVLVTRAPSGPELPVAPGGGSVSHCTADLSSLDSVRRAAGQIADRLRGGDLPPLSGFVGNAGIQYTNARTTGADGLEATFTVNVLANHLFVRVLRDHFRTPARIVLTTSDTHFGDLRHNLAMVPGPVWRPPEVLARPGAFPAPESTAAGRTAYSTSKLAAIYLVHEYARRLPAGIDAVAFNPGFVPGTGLARHADPLSRFAMRYLLPALTLTPLAVSPRTAGHFLADIVLGATPAPNGSYVDRRRVARSSAASYAPDRERDLWATVESLTADRAG